MGINKIGVAHENRDYLIGVSLQPAHDFDKIGFQGASIEEFAGRMAKVECAIDQMGLELNCKC
jgi:hypothetical protein